MVQIYVLKSVKRKSQKKRKNFHHRIQWWNSHWKICFIWHFISGHWIRWTNQCWICHRIRCITKFFTEFGAEKCVFSFTGGYRAHTSDYLEFIFVPSFLCWVEILFLFQIVFCIKDKNGQAESVSMAKEVCFIHWTIEHVGKFVNQIFSLRT